MAAALERDLGEHALAPSAIGPDMGRHAGLDVARCQAVDEHVRRQLAGKRADQPDDAALGGAVADMVERAAAERQRAHEHDPADPLLVEAAACGHHHVEGVGEVRRLHSVPHRARVGGEILRLEQPRQMDERVDGPVDRIEHLLASSRRGEVGDRGRHPQAGRELLGERLEPGRVAIDQQQPGALGEQQLRRFAADPAGRPGDDDQPSVVGHRGGRLPFRPGRSGGGAPLVKRRGRVARRPGRTGRGRSELRRLRSVNLAGVRDPWTGGADPGDTARLWGERHDADDRHGARTARPR
ncbi:MAG: hypothetical protein NZ555_11085 [Geminicoccaceae bacterium]|nr:hypothetical protein [Geminicoccaceae bacterium]